MTKQQPKRAENALAPYLPLTWAVLLSMNKGYLKRLEFPAEVQARMYVSAMRHQGWDLTDPVIQRNPAKKLIWVVLILKKPLFS